MTSNDAGRPSRPASLHQRILTDIEQRIFCGQWPPGHRIPSEHELADAYAVSRMTVNKVLTQLAHASLIERRRKAGSFVARTQSRSALLEIQEIKAEVTALGLPYRFDVLRRKKRRSLRVDRDLLELAEPGPLLDVSVVHFAGDRPFCLEDRLINLAAAPEAADETFDEIAPGPWLVSRVPWTSAEHRIRAEAADEAVAKALKLPQGTPCLVIERRTWRSAQPVTRVRLSYPGDLRELVARFSPMSS